ncbi:MAG: HNH endonuclease [Flavobacteriales bacterium]|nr:HNH endonuclease [Flavobacteriales bacterium]
MRILQATYGDLLRREEWRTKRRAILQRDGHACRNCGARNRLQVHHRQYHRCQRTGHKLAPWCYNDRYLVTLCDDCHHNGHHIHRVPRYII